MEKLRALPWLRIFAEGVAIVVSILLAFSIEAWWADRGDREEEKRLLEALREEMVANEIVILEARQFHSALAESSMSLLKAFANEQDLSDEELDKAIGSLGFGYRTYFQYGVVTGLIQSGKLSLIQDESLRNQVASILGEQARVISTQGNQDLTYASALMPFLRKNASVPQISNAQSAAPGTDDYAQPELPIRQIRNHQHLIDSEEFIGIVTEVYWNQNDSITSISKYRTFARDLMTRLDEVLDQMSR